MNLVNKIFICKHSNILAFIQILILILIKRHVNLAQIELL